jgi:hypothetical protein
MIIESADVVISASKDFGSVEQQAAKAAQADGQQEQ